MNRTREQVIWDFVEGWLRKAEGDLRVSEVMMEMDLEDWFAAAFHAQLESTLASSAMLTPFGTEFRYPGEIIDLETAKQAMREAERVKAAILNRLKDYVDKGRP